MQNVNHPAKEKTKKLHGLAIYLFLVKQIILAPYVEEQKGKFLFQIYNIHVCCGYY